MNWFTIPVLSKSEISLILQDVWLLAVAHKDQARANGAPYIVHLLDVADRVLISKGEGLLDRVRAALFHDADEDTWMTPEDIEARTNKNVARIVKDVTNEKVSDTDRPARKARDKARLAASGADSQTVKAADLGSNLGDSSFLPLKRRKRYVKEAEELLEVLTLADIGVVARTRADLAAAKLAISLVEADATDG